MVAYIKYSTKIDYNKKTLLVYLTIELLIKKPSLNLPTGGDDERGGGGLGPASSSRHGCVGGLGHPRPLFMAETSMLNRVRGSDNTWSTMGMMMIWWIYSFPDGPGPLDQNGHGTE